VRAKRSDGWFCGIVRVRGLGQIRVWFYHLGQPYAQLQRAALYFREEIIK